MKDIMVRIWDKNRKEWLHDTEHAVNLFGETILLGVLLQRRDGSFVKISELNNLVPMQYIEQKDKSGKNIFKDDVVRWIDTEGHIHVKVVRWDKELACWCYGVMPILKLKESGFFQTEVEVIGNKHDKPRLIKKLT